MKICKNCGKEIADKAVLCVHCGCNLKEKKPLFKKWWFWILIVVLIIGIAAGSSGGGEDQSANTNPPPAASSTESNSSKTEQKPSVPEEYAEKCPISISASLEDNIIGFPEIKCNIKNNTDKEIAAIQFYLIPKNVYGEESNNILTENKLSTDDPIGAKESVTRSWQLLDQETKTGDLYVYSVYFTDGTEWGDKNASNSRIKKYGYKISVEN